MLLARVTVHVQNEKKMLWHKFPPSLLGLYCWSLGASWWGRAWLGLYTPFTHAIMLADALQPRIQTFYQPSVWHNSRATKFRIMPIFPFGWSISTFFLSFLKISHRKKKIENATKSRYVQWA
jgi:hypothetical protein